jgi:acyl-CoA synthetase (AMP-forming)/AMP-acid ligase II
VGYAGPAQPAANPLPRSQRRPGSAGRPTGVPVRIAGADGGDLPPGDTGAVEIRGPQVIRAYLGPGRTPIPARGADGWLPTGDLAFRDPDGFLYLVRRSDDVINRGGEKIHPREIEDVLLCDPDIRGAAVVGRPHRLLGEECVAYVLTDPGDVSPGLPAIDLVKFGWGTALVTPRLEEKMACLEQHGIGYFFGGTLFEKFVAQDLANDYIEFCQRSGCEYLEVSDGTIHLAASRKAQLIARGQGVHRAERSRLQGR